jgi:serine/threonine protein kinase
LASILTIFRNFLKILTGCLPILLGHGEAEKYEIEYESSFMKEAGILVHLKHPNIVDFICCGNGLEKGDCFIAMELMEMSLFDLIKKHKQKGEHLSTPVALDIMVQVARGVCYLHS